MAFTVLQAQTTLPEKCLVAQPDVLLKSILKQSDIDKFLKNGQWGQDKKSEKYWIVWSDRSQNKTYKGPSTNSGEYRELEFGQALRIAKIENNFALVYIEPMDGFVFPKISNAARRDENIKGWVPMNHLLLWPLCPSDQFGIYDKALIVMNLEEIQNSKESAGWIMTNPATKDGKKELSYDMNFYFVMKKEGNMALLSHDCTMTGKSDRVLYGWASENSFIHWTERTCLEPNWKPLVAEDLKDEKVWVRRNGKNTTYVLMGQDNPASRNRATKYRMDKDLLRYPLHGKNDKEYKVTAFAAFGDYKPYNPKANIDGTKSRNEKTEQLLDKAKTINIIVVIDGTNSMKDYYAPVKEAVLKASNTFGDDADVRVGVVIYRDYPAGQYVTEMLPMTSPKNKKLSDFLESGGQGGIGDLGKDNTYEEALYKGLEVALDAKAMGYERQNTNLMFVVGDCGNSPNDNKCLTQEQIIQKMVDLRIHIEAFQVRNQRDKAFDLFRMQMAQIIMGKLKAQKAFDLDEEGKWAKFTPSNDGGYDYVTNLGEMRTYFVAGMRVAPQGKVMEIPKLNSLITDCYFKFNQAKKNVDGIVLDPTIIRSGKIVGAKNKLEYNVMKDLVGDTKQLKELEESGALTAFSGQADRKSTNGQDYWQSVLYISDSEFEELLKKLGPVANKANGGDRNDYVEAMKALARSVNPEKSAEQINGMSTEEIMAMIGGFSEAPRALSSYTLADIESPERVSKEVFDGIVTAFAKKYQALENFKTSDYPFSFVRNGTKWYWIPLDDLP